MTNHVRRSRKCQTSLQHRLPLPTLPNTGEPSKGLGQSPVHRPKHWIRTMKYGKGPKRAETCMDLHTDSYGPNDSCSCVNCVDWMMFKDYEISFSFSQFSDHWNISLWNLRHFQNSLMSKTRCTTLRGPKIMRLFWNTNLDRPDGWSGHLNNPSSRWHLQLPHEGSITNIPTQL